MCDGKNILKLVHTSAPLTYYAISPPNKLCASEGATCYGICRSVCPSLFAVIMASVRTRVGPTLSTEILQWSWGELARRHEPANQSVKHLHLNATDARACDVLLYVSISIPLGFNCIRIWTLQEHLGLCPLQHHTRAVRPSSLWFNPQPRTRSGASCR